VDQNEAIINNFDFDAGCEELCLVGDDGYINFIRINQPQNDPITSFGKIFIILAIYFSSLLEIFFTAYREFCGLNSVLYVKQYEIAVADSLGRIKLWDTRNKSQNKASMTLAV
jgi:hypothetical protein